MASETNSLEMESFLLKAITQKIDLEAYRILDRHRKEIDDELSGMVKKELATFALNLSSMVSFDRLGKTMTITVHDMRAK